ncbi:hypothetical protein BAQ48_00090 [Bacillus luti]|uniref:hypothetical protein n=1 Tax=Bacillus luti TaxID=2026191 RepID=UPI0008FDD56C|nr:hypothetical protein [Bacillus luti]OJE52879.1 hypothetical protein BAQ48_00090 [Bacillus luti]
MYHLPIQFAQKLEGKTCFVSRVKKNIESHQEFPLFTLHQIVYKILRKGEKANYYTNRLAGETTFSNVENAISSVTGHIPSDSAVKKIYYQIRAHKNQNINLKEFNNGSEYLQQYQAHLGDELDWEDSMQTATWLLNHGNVSSLYRFLYKNIILVKPELLDLPTNKTAKKFFLAWCEWISNYTKWNIYVVDHRGQIKQYQNGTFVTTKNSDSRESLFLC